MIALQSLWTNSGHYQFTRGLLMLFSASAASVNRCFADTELVTDMQGLVIADRLRWRHVSFSTALQEFCPERARKAWAAGKMHAQLIQSKPTIHIDLDVCPLEPFRPEILQARVAVQNKDTMAFYVHPGNREYLEMMGIEKGNVAYNLGITLFNDVNLRTRFCKASLERIFEGARIIEDGTVLSILGEQALFSQMMRQERVRVVECIPMHDHCTNEDFRFAKFTHHWSNTKSNPVFLAKVEKRFRDEFPQEYSDFQFGFNELLKRGIATP